MTMHKDIDFREFARGVATIVKYAKDDIIFQQDDDGPFMCVLLSGSVEITRDTRVIEIIHEGKALGILSLLDGCPRATTARAREACELAIMNRRKFRYMVEEVPNFVWYVMDELAHRLRATNAAL